MRILATCLFILSLLCATGMKAQVSKIRQDFIDFGFPRYEQCTMKILPGAKEKFKDLELLLCTGKTFHGALLIPGKSEVDEVLT